jgi:hypothetical protein
MAYTPADLSYPPLRSQQPRRERPLTPEQITRVYQTGFQRTPSQEEINVHMANPGGYRGFIDTVAASEEGRSRGLRPRDLVGGPRTGPQTGPPAGPTSDASGRSGTPTGTERPWAGSNMPYEGFDFTRTQNVEKSAKDAFADFTREAAAQEPPPWEDKAALGDWFQRHIAPRMNALGHQINWVNGDQVNFTNWQGTFTIDWVRGAGAPGAAFAWQTQEGSTETPGASFSGARGDNHTQPVPPPTTNPDGTVSIRVTPEAYRRFSTQQYQRRRRPVDFIPTENTQVVP